tara:strand:- start:307 stop:735 length:429 start_codon:yes stop_codon:yes gene_type:complete
MPETLGSITKTTFLNEVENHKLHLEFEVETGQSVEQGQPLVLTATGTVQAAGAGASKHLVIGYSLHQSAAGELCTVGMRAYAVTFSEAETAVAAGPVKYAGFNATTVYNKYEDDAVTAADAIGWSLDAAASAGDIIRVALMD